MFLAIHDYLKFRRVSGRYTPFQADRMDTLYYIREIPPDVLAEMRDMDSILVGNVNTIMSWAINYLTDSLFSHVAFYRGSGQVAHHLTQGTVIEPITNLFGPGMVFLPVRFGGDDPKIQSGLQEYADRFLRPSVGYNFRKVASLGVQYLLCINRHGFHWRNYVDLGVVIATISTLALVLGVGVPFVVVAAALWIGVGAVQFYRFRNRQPLYIDAPEATYRVAMHNGWPVMFNFGGYRDYLMDVQAHFAAQGLAMETGKSYPVPEHLRVRVKD
jgi:hypothetical protein